MLPFLRTALLKRGSTFVARNVRSMPQRNYATVHTTKAGGDTPWIIGSVAFTVPAVFYLMSGNDHSGAHAHKHADHHGHSTAGKKVESAKQAVTDAASKASEKASEATQSVKQKAAEATSNASKNDVKETAESVKEKAGETAKGAKESASGTTEKAKQAVAETTEKAKEKASELTEKAKASKENLKDKVLPDDPEAPGAEKHPRLAVERERLEENRKPRGDTAQVGQGQDATNREAGSENVQSGKQGPLNQDTFHSQLGSEKGKEISKKAEGVHDSARLKGSVDPERRGS